MSFCAWDRFAECVSKKVDRCIPLVRSENTNFCSTTTQDLKRWGLRWYILMHEGNGGSRWLVGLIPSGYAAIFLLVQNCMVSNVVQLLSILPISALRIPMDYDQIKETMLLDICWEFEKPKQLLRIEGLGNKKETQYKRIKKGEKG